MLLCCLSLCPQCILMLLFSKGQNNRDTNLMQYCHHLLDYLYYVVLDKFACEDDEYCRFFFFVVELLWHIISQVNTQIFKINKKSCRLQIWTVNVRLWFNWVITCFLRKTNVALQLASREENEKSTVMSSKEMRQAKRLQQCTTKHRLMPPMALTFCT